MVLMNDLALRLMLCSAFAQEKGKKGNEMEMERDKDKIDDSQSQPLLLTATQTLHTISPTRTPPTRERM